MLSIHVYINKCILDLLNLSFLLFYLFIYFIFFYLLIYFIFIYLSIYWFIFLHKISYVPFFFSKSIALKFFDFITFRPNQDDHFQAILYLKFANALMIFTLIFMQCVTHGKW